MRAWMPAALAAAWLTSAMGAGAATMNYWNLFNVEEETTLNAQFATYGSLLDMLNDENRTGVFTPDGSGIFGRNIVGAGSDGKAFWSVFNVEEETRLNAQIATYATTFDMLNDENRVGVSTPDGSGIFGRNIVGSGSDGRTYWNVFNVEEETTLNAQFATYASLLDMLNDENRTGVFTPDGSGIFGRNIVGSGSDGTTYWNVFNVEEETTLNAQFATYGSLLDMLNDENRTGVFTPDGSGIFGRNIVGSGAFVALPTQPAPIPLPAAGLLLAAAVAGLGVAVRMKPR